MNSAPSTSYICVWALPVRIAHWSLAALILFDLFNDSGGKVHRYSGYAAAAVVVLRLFYGIIERSGPARLHLPKPSECWKHLHEMLSGRVPRLAGHNALGAAMTLLLWALVLLLALTGWVSRWDMFWGEDWPKDLHTWLSYTLQVCVILHLLGVTVGSVLERQNLVRGMISGKKYVDRVPCDEHSREPSDR